LDGHNLPLKLALAGRRSRRRTGQLSSRRATSGVEEAGARRGRRAGPGRGDLEHGCGRGSGASSGSRGRTRCQCLWGRLVLAQLVLHRTEGAGGGPALLTHTHGQPTLRSPRRAWLVCPHPCVPVV
jgi:hypothetical protein